MWRDDRRRTGVEQGLLAQRLRAGHPAEQLRSQHGTRVLRIGNNQPARAWLGLGLGLGRGRGLGLGLGLELGLGLGLGLDYGEGRVHRPKRGSRWLSR